MVASSAPATPEQAWRAALAVPAVPPYASSTAPPLESGTAFSRSEVEAAYRSAILYADRQGRSPAMLVEAVKSPADFAPLLPAGTRALRAELEADVAAYVSSTENGGLADDAGTSDRAAVLGSLLNVVQARPAAGRSRSAGAVSLGGDVADPRGFRGPMTVTGVRIREAPGPRLVVSAAVTWNYRFLAAGQPLLSVVSANQSWTFAREDGVVLLDGWHRSGLDIRGPT